MANTKAGLLIGATRATGPWRLAPFLMGLKESRVSVSKISAGIAMLNR